MKLTDKCGDWESNNEIEEILENNMLNKHIIYNNLNKNIDNNNYPILDISANDNINNIESTGLFEIVLLIIISIILLIFLIKYHRN